MQYGAESKVSHPSESVDHRLLTRKMNSFLSRILVFKYQRIAKRRNSREKQTKHHLFLVNYKVRTGELIGFIMIGQKCSITIRRELELF